MTCNENCNQGRNCDCGGAQHSGGLVDTVVNHWVNRFLGWKLPKDFAPDAGISFKKDCEHESAHWPVGTNLLTADQAKAMFEHCLGPAVMVNLNGALIDAVIVDVEADGTQRAGDGPRARIAALEAENAELKTRINDLATDWQVLRLKLETARNALGSCGKAICREQVSLIAEEALAAIGEAQPASDPLLTTRKFDKEGYFTFEPAIPEARHPSEFDLSGDNDFNRGWNECREAMLSACANREQPARAEVKPDLSDIGLVGLEALK